MEKFMLAVPLKIGQCSLVNSFCSLNRLFLLDEQEASDLDLAFEAKLK